VTGPRISVVVPFYNNAGDLAACLASIAAQTVADLEVIMVDDGSADGSTGVAERMTAADPRFRLLRLENGGPGRARNAGVAAASGEYLAFVDADDVLPPDAYATLLGVLERSGSDFATGAVLRLTPSGLGESGLHDQAIRAARTRTHISRAPELFYDISVWNKLFRRSFWDARGLRLPEGMLWEDLVAMTRAHVLAGAVDVVTRPVYHWRDRTAGAPSITQSRTDLRNLRDRITALGMIDEFLREQGTPAMLAAHQRKALGNDLWLYVRDLPRAGEEYQRELAGLIGGYLRTVAGGVRDALPSARRLAYHLIEHGRREEVTALAAWLAEQPRRTPPMIRTPRGLRADLPYRRDRTLAVPDRVFRPLRRELDPYVRVEELSWSPRGALVIGGYAYVPSMDIGARRHATKLVLLVPPGRRGLPVVLRARAVRRPDLTDAYGAGRYRYDWAGFSCSVGPRRLRAMARRAPGDWDGYVLVRGRAIWRPARLHTPGPAAGDPQARQVAPGVTAGAHWAGRRLQVRVRRGDGARPKEPAGPPGAGGPAAGPVAAAPALTSQEWDAGGALVLHGQVPEPGGWEIELRHLDGWARHAVPVPEGGDREASGQAGRGAAGFTVAVPVHAMEQFGQARPLRDGTWQVRLRRRAAGPAPGPAASPATAAPAGAPAPRTDRRAHRAGRKLYRCRPGSSGDLLLLVGPALGPAERGRIRRRLLREAWYRAQRLLPPRDWVLFMSFAGKQSGDNPRAIADELRRRGDRSEHIWAVADWSVPVPDGSRAVLIGTAAYYRALARSARLVVNDHMPQPYRKRRGQRHIQTWHGAPLKRLGHDIAEPRFASGRRYFEFLDRDVAQWDLLLSPSPFATPILRRAFGYRGEIRETGYPRDDVLHAGGAERAARVRRRLDLPGSARVAMYVPTWRDDEHDAAGRYRLDFRLDLAAAARRLAPDWVLLIRGHHLMAGERPAGADGSFAVDVTGYPDIGDLLLVTDALITDYSSVLFDFAPTGRPVLLFTYDLERYRDRLRGFYLDLESVAPGPLLATSDEVISALADIDAVAARWEPARAAFTARFCPLDDGKASARACEVILGG